jgi:hypothetical protein
MNVAGFESFAAGTRARALHTGTFVWSDGTYSETTSTADHQFLIRASGGVGINTNNPQTALHVAGTVTATSFNGSNIGIGTSTPQEKLTIAGVTSYNNGLKVTGSSANGIGMSIENTVGAGYKYDLIAGGSGNTGIGEGGFGIWREGGASYPLAIAVNGNVGIGTVTSPPNQKLEVVGRIRMDTWTADGNILVYKNASGDIGLQSSDIRLKKNVETIPDALAVVNGLRGVTFNWLNDSAQAPKTVGLIAQEVHAAMPELTFEFQNDDGQTLLGVHYEKVAAVLVNALQQQQSQIRRQESEIGDLKTRLEKLEQLLNAKSSGAK